MISIKDIADQVSYFSEKDDISGVKNIKAIDEDSYISIINELRDHDWSPHSWAILPSFLSKGNNSAIEDMLNATKKIKYTDTRLGGNFYFNTMPQASRWADYNEPRICTNLEADDFKEVSYDISSGMGRWYSEEIDDRVSLVHIRSGVVQYQPTLMYMLNSYDPVLDTASRQGLLQNIAFKLGQISGFLSGFSIPIQGTLFAIKTLNAMFIGSSSEYATMKPTTAITWRRIQTLSDNMNVGLGWRPDDSAEVTRFKANGDVRDELFGVNKADLDAYNQIMGDIFKDNYSVDLRASSTRAYRIRAVMNEIAKNAMESVFSKIGDGEQPDGEVYLKAIDKATQAQIDALSNDKALRLKVDQRARTTNEIWSEDGELANSIYYQDNGSKKGVGSKSFEELYSSYDENQAKVDNSSANNSTANLDAETLKQLNINSSNSVTAAYNTPLAIQVDDNVDASIKKQALADANSFIAFLNSERNDGSAFFSFAVGGNNTANDTFTNQSKEPLIKSFLGSLSGKFRDLSASTSGGSIIPGMGEILGTAASFVRGKLDGFGVGGIAGIFSMANPSVPNIPDSSSASLQNVTISFEARPVSGSVLSLYLSEYSLLAIFLGLVTPYSSGNQSYGLPPVIEYYQKGFANSRFAMVSSFAVTRGTGNKGWSTSGLPLGMTFHLELTPLATDVHFPIYSNALTWRGTSAISTYLAKGLYDQDNVGKDYLNAITGVDFQTQIYGFRKIHKNIQAALMSMKTSFTYAGMAQGVMDTPIVGNILSGISPGNYNKY